MEISDGQCAKEFSFSQCADILVCVLSSGLGLGLLGVGRSPNSVQAVPDCLEPGQGSGLRHRAGGEGGTGKGGRGPTEGQSLGTEGPAQETA